MKTWCDSACSSGGVFGAPPPQICPQHHVNSLIKAQHELAIAMGQQVELDLKLKQANTDVLVPLPTAAGVMSGVRRDQRRSTRVSPQQSQAVLKRIMAMDCQTELTAEVQAGKDLILRLFATLHAILSAAAEDAYTP